MKIEGIQSFLPKLPELKEIHGSENEKDLFGNLITGLIDKVNSDQMASAKLTNDFIEGKEVELHEVMIAGEKAKTSLDLLMEIRNKTLDMYRELTRIQI